MPRPRALRLLSVVISSSVAVASGQDPAASIRPTRLRCEFRDDPTAIATSAPRLSWILEPVDPAARGAAQTAYRVVVAADDAALAAEGPYLWDSGVVRASARTRSPTKAVYAGAPLQSRARAVWRARVWDERGRPSEWSAPARFRLGLLSASDWGDARWIGRDATAEPPLTEEVRATLRRMPWIRSPGPVERRPRVAWFRREFDLDEPVAEAWIAGTADQLAEIRVNGVVVGALARWETVRAIDVRAALRPGRNVLAARVEHFDGLPPALTGGLFLRTEGGVVHGVPCDASWSRADAAPDVRDPAALDAAAWSAVEVAAAQPWGAARNTEHFHPPAPHLRREFVVAPGRTVARATLYATALGVYEARLNGARVGDAVMPPGWTEYSKRVEHQTYDVTAMVRPGANCLGAVLGDGWYAGLLGYTGRRRFYGGPARLLARLEIDYADGGRDAITTDAAWRAGFGAVRGTDNYFGSEVDFRLDVPGWDLPGFDDAAWPPAEVGLARSERVSDVTTIVREALRRGEPAPVVGPALLGDPAYGVVKTLRIDYVVDGVAKTADLPEGAPLRLRDATGAEVRRATFGPPPAPPAPPPVVEPQAGEPVRRIEEIAAVAVSEPRPGRYVVDFGQNLVGWARLRVDGARGDRVVVRHAEVLNADGTLYVSNLRGAAATDVYVLAGGPAVLEPPFTFHGFRYAEITGFARRPEPSSVVAVVAHTSLRPTGTFECSDARVNRLVSNIRRGQRGNFFDLPTDCPQRDERLGWTGDAQFFVKTAASLFDVASFMERWLRTLIVDAQYPDGTFAHVAPKVSEPGGSTAWGDAAIVCVDALYEIYGDERLVVERYDALRRYMDWLDGRTKDGLAQVGGFGDWLHLDDPTDPVAVDTAYRADLSRMMARLARVAGRPDDVARFEAARSASTEAFRRRFVAEDGSLKGCGQTGYALAFTADLVPEALRSRIADRFADAIARRGGRLATGFVGTPRLLPALRAAGREDLAARLLLTEDYPSWLRHVKLGATTMWERWDGYDPERGFADVGMNSFNHYAFGSVGEYLFRHVGGVLPLAPGYAEILVAPTLPDGLSFASTSYDSVAGPITSAWRRLPDGVAFEIATPPHTTALLRLPLPQAPAGRVVDVLESGRPVAEAPGLVVVSAPTDPAAPTILVLRAAPGTYRFVASVVPAPR